jgi:hypothetical protein
MIASDTSTWIAFLEGNSGDDVEMLTKALGDRQVVMATAVLTELLSDPELPSSAALRAVSTAEYRLSPETSTSRPSLIRRGLT